jgi:hypothetical protein
MIGNYNSGYSPLPVIFKAFYLYFFLKYNFEGLKIVKLKQLSLNFFVLFI